MVPNDVPKPGSRPAADEIEGVAEVEICLKALKNKRVQMLLKNKALTAATATRRPLSRRFCRDDQSRCGHVDSRCRRADGADLPLAACGSGPTVPARWPQDAAQHLRGQRVLVLGLGASGLAMARWCARAGAQVTVADTRSAPPQLALLQAELPSVRFIAGPLRAPSWWPGRTCAAVYRSPGLAPQVIAPVVDAARAIGLPVGGELDLFAKALAALAQQHGYAPKVLAITGTNGKTTVTALTGKLLEHAGWSVAVAGNIGPSLLDTLAHHLDAENLPQAWVLELSSFQLEGVQDFEPTAAVVLNITQDHLDWHGSMARLCRGQGTHFW